MSTELTDELDEGILRLGEQRSVHRTNRFFAVLFGTILAVGGAILLVPAAFLLGAGNAADAELGWMALSYALPLLTLGGFLGWWWWIGRDRGVILFTDGVALLRPQDARAVHFDDVAAVWYEVTRIEVHGVPVTISHVYTLDLRDGAREKLTGVDRVQHLGGEIQEAVADRLLPFFAAAWLAGQTIDFGPIQYTPEGIRHGKNLLTWQDAHSVQVNEGVVQIQKEGAWFNWATVPVSTIPNAHLLVPLAKVIFERVAPPAAEEEKPEGDE